MRLFLAALSSFSLIFVSACSSDKASAPVAQQAPKPSNNDGNRKDQPAPQPSPSPTSDQLVLPHITDNPAQPPANGSAGPELGNNPSVPAPAKAEFKMPDDKFKGQDAAFSAAEECLKIKEKPARLACLKDVSEWLFFFGDQYFDDDSSEDVTSYSALGAIEEAAGGPADTFGSLEQYIGAREWCLAKEAPFRRFNCDRFLMDWTYFFGKSYAHPNVEADLKALELAALAAGTEAENVCYEGPKDKRNECLMNVANWWFKHGGNYVEYNPFRNINRIMKEILKDDPRDVDAISNLSYYAFSIEVDELISKKITDFTDAPLNAFLDYESQNLDNFDFYNFATSCLLAIVHHTQFGSDAVHDKYYFEMVRFQNKARELWDKIDKTQLPPDAVKNVETQLAAMDRIVKRFSDPNERHVKPKTSKK